jgi:glycosyltransferase involved in cell wall biosynthesis
MQCDWLVQLDQKLIEPRLRMAHRITGCSDYVTDGIRRRFPAVADRCRTFHNATHAFDTREATGERADNQPAQILQILFVGRVSPEKGVHVLLDAFKRVLAQRPNTKLILLGGIGSMPKEYYLDLADPAEQQDLARFYDNDYLQLLRSQLSEHELAHVSFEGGVLNDSLGPYYRAADVAVFPSVWQEPFGIVIVEAMARGCAVVATRSGGIPEIIESGKSGLLVERNDSDSLASALLKLLDDSALRQRLGDAARQRVENCFTWERVAHHIANEYLQLGQSEADLVESANHVCAAQ